MRKNTMTIRVTREDIHKGRRNSKSSCPVALAVNRKIGQSAVALVGSDRIIAHDRWDLTKAVRNFIYDFDMGKKVKPFTARLKMFRYVFEHEKLKGDHT
jgi:hypothetical protein